MSKARVTKIHGAVVGEDFVMLGNMKIMKPKLRRAEPISGPNKSMPLTCGAIQVGQRYCDSDASIYNVVMVRDMPNSEVQIGIEPTWNNHRGTVHFTRGVNEAIPSSINVYDQPAPELESRPTL